MKTSNCVVTEATLADAAYIIPAQIQMALETEDMRLDLNTVTQGVTAIFKNPHHGKYYVARVDGKIAGCLLTIPEWSDWRNGVMLWIHSVYVDPAFRAQGVYKAMYEYLKVKAQAGEFRGMRLYVDKRNKRAQQDYEKLGMSNEHYEMYEWMV